MRFPLALALLLASSLASGADDRPPAAKPARPASGLTPENAAAAMTVPPEFAVTLFAGEPDVHQPIAFAIDHRGRLWVVEAYTYPRRHPHPGPVLPEKDRKLGDKILIFEDTDGDGKFDKKTVFVEGLNLVSGIEVGFGGVWVGAAPYLLFIPHDEKTDRPAGEPQVLLDGWGFEDTHETLNSFTWGPDGWLYGCHGVFTHSRVGKPGTPNADRVPINAGVWRYHPTKHVFEVFAEGTSNPWGLDYNDNGDFFVEACVIPHCFHIIQGARYLRQAGGHFNPHTYADIGTIADHLHYVGNQWNDGDRARSGDLGGGHAHCGLMCYLGGTWPAKYRGQLFMGNIHGKRLNMDVPRAKGSGYVAGHGPDFLLANDEWARFVNLKSGPDGNVYLIDWYDKQACHNPEPAIWDRTNGRVYKVSLRGSKSVKGLDLKKCSDAELAAYQSHDNDWYVRQARKILQERVAAEPGRAAAIRDKLTQAAPAKDAPAAKQLRHLWAAHAAGGLDPAACAALLEDAKLPEQVRAWAVQLALEDKQPTPALLDAFASAAKSDASPLVRRYIASGLQRVPVDKRPAIAVGLLARAEDATDFNLPLLTWYAIEPVAGADPKAALELAAGAKNPQLLQFTARRVAAGRQHDALPEALAKAVAGKNTAALLAVLRGMGEGFRGRRDVPMPASWAEVSEQLLRYDAEEVRSLAASLSVTFGNTKALTSLREVLADATADAARRQAAIATLVAARDQNLPPLLQQLLADGAVRGAALRGLAAFDDPKTPAAILAVWSSLTTDERRDALGTLAARPVFAHALLDAVAAKQLSPADVPADVVRAMRGLPDRAVATKIGQIWGVIRDTATDKTAAIAAVRKTLAAPGAADLSLGRAVFAKSCQQCHTLYGLGGKVGPDITGSNRADLDYLLENILDPSAVIPKEYMATTFRLGDGRTVMGIVKGDDGAAFTVQTATEVLTINKEDVDELKHSKTSMMPDGLLQTLKDDEVRALFGYLRHPKQVALLATAENAKDLFNAKDLAGWSGDPKVWSVDRGEIVARADELAKDAVLASEMTAENFRLSFRAKVSGGDAATVEVRGGGEARGHRVALGGVGWGNADDWSECVIEARGGHVKLTVNGRECADLTDDKLARRGRFVLHLHAGKAVELRVKDLRLDLLDAKK